MAFCVYGLESVVKLILHVICDFFSHGPVLGGFIVTAYLKEDVPGDPLEGLFVLSVGDFVELGYLVFLELVLEGDVESESHAFLCSGLEGLCVCVAAGGELHVSKVGREGDEIVDGAYEVPPAAVHVLLVALFGNVVAF